ncbi:acyltransferase family protein [Acinetobacter sp. WCHAc010052]|uniref:acyltransferase family protein n=1 Tax=Acinetobacter sp. WCHAc010052 TaxID=2004647 RepID=UPI000B3CBFE9|nr:acyltransferase family protein [Acinetobacter sp. WCHAc010052]AXY58999.1 acyltransferase [Acinetobacter sp. WCHAc010052]
MKKKFNLSHPKYRPDIDGLRAIAVLAVVLFHAFPSSLRGGFIGVDIFFVISGFLISTIIYENIKNETFSFKDFYSRRIRRIFPALLVVVITTFIFGFFILSADEFNKLGKLVAAGIGFVANLVLWSEAGYFDSATETKTLLHLWSLGIEEQFYFFWPLLLFFAWKRNFNLLIVTIIVLFFSLIFNILNIKTDPIATFYSPVTRIWELLFGSLLAWVVVFKNDKLLNLNKTANASLSKMFFFKHIREEYLFSNILSFSGMIFFLIGFIEITKESNFPGFWALLPVLGTVMVIMAGPTAWINKNILSNKIAVWFGLISFPLYLWHWPILSYGRIYYDKTPPESFRWIAILASILLAWLTVKYIEKPFRYSKYKTQTKVIFLCSTALILGLIGLITYKVNFMDSKIFNDLKIQRKGFEHAYGPSLNWYEGKENWLFLGNNHDASVEKLKLVTPPNIQSIEAIHLNMKEIVNTAALFNTHVLFIMGPNKENIYTEFLPTALVPSELKYSSYFLNSLRKIPKLSVYDPTLDLKNAKEKEGILYWKTDTHWNQKGAYIAFSGLARMLSQPIPKVKFHLGPIYEGDLIGISQLKNFPLSASDNWIVVWDKKPISIEKRLSYEHESSFGHPRIVTTKNALTDKYVWVIGDSFSNGLATYINATFKEVRYIGHWSDKLNNLSEELNKANKKPDFIIIERVERSF